MTATQINRRTNQSGTPHRPRVQPFGAWTRGGQTAGAAVIAAGAIPIAFIAPTFYGRTPRLWSVLIAIGVVALIAWLVDGRRYIGAGAASLAIGSALGLAAEAGLDRYRFALVFGLLGVAILAAWAVNVRAVLGSVGLLFFTGASAAIVHLIGVGGTDPQPAIPQAWAYVPLMLLWGLAVFAKVRGRSGEAAGEPERDEEVQDVGYDRTLAGTRS